MISIFEAIDILKQNAPSLKTESVDLQHAVRRTLAEDLYAREASPRYTNSAMDGFAVRWEDVQHVSEGHTAKLKVIGESRAGVPFEGTVSVGEAVRISTGAMLPKGADTVVPVEEVDDHDTEITVLQVKKQWNHVRFEGEEIKAGDILLEAGTTLYPEHIALLASQGIIKLNVYASPKVALFTTGTEVRPYTESIEPFQLRDSNLVMLKSAVRLAGGYIISTTHIPDDQDETIRLLAEKTEEADILILTGGVSMGPHDHVKEAAEAIGFETVFWKINQKPGKPFFFARKNGKLLFGLPGNPVSAFMGYVHYIHPLLTYLMSGKWEWKTTSGMLTAPLKAKGERFQMIRVKIEAGESEAPKITVLARQGSHMLTSIAEADGYILAEPGKEYVQGEKINVYKFPWRD